MAKLIFGCGYLGQRVAQLWLARGETVYAVTRSPERAEKLSATGIRPLVADLTGTTQLELPQGLSTVLFAVGFDRTASANIHEVYCGGLARALSWMHKDILRFLYISSTGVYGHASGEEVDEETPCAPLRDGGKACLAAEGLLRQSEFGDRSVVLRLAGIYGPGRIPRADELRAGKPIDAPAEGWLNLIHVEDAAQIVLLAEAAALVPRTYVVSDGNPVLRREYYTELARLLGAPAPRFVSPRADSPAALRAASDKRINPRRLFAEMRPVLLYPDYRTGLAAITASVL